MNMPTWAVPRLSSVPVPFKTARARLGAQAANAKLTPLKRVKRAKNMHSAWMKATTPEQRREWARVAGRAGAAKRWGIA